MRKDRVDDYVVFFILFRKVRADLHVRAFDFEVHRLAKIVQQPRAFRQIYVYAEFGRHRAGKVRHLKRVPQHVLPVTRSEFQTAEQLDDFGMQAEQTAFEHCVFSVLLDLRVEFFFDFLHRLFYSRGVNASVRDEFFERDAGYFPSHRVETR